MDVDLGNVRSGLRSGRGCFLGAGVNKWMEMQADMGR